MPEHEAAGHLVETHDDVRVSAHAEHLVPALVERQVRVAGTKVVPVLLARGQNTPDHVRVGSSLLGHVVRGGALLDLSVGQRRVEDADLVDQAVERVLAGILPLSDRQVRHSLHALGDAQGRVGGQCESARRVLRLGDLAAVDVQTQRAASRPRRRPRRSGGSSGSGESARRP